MRDAKRIHRMVRDLEADVRLRTGFKGPSRTWDAQPYSRGYVDALVFVREAIEQDFELE